MTGIDITAVWIPNRGQKAKEESGNSYNTGLQVSSFQNESIRHFTYQHLNFCRTCAMAQLDKLSLDVETRRGWQQERPESQKKPPQKQVMIWNAHEAHFIYSEVKVCCIAQRILPPGCHGPMTSNGNWINVGKWVLYVFWIYMSWKKVVTNEYKIKGCRQQREGWTHYVRLKTDWNAQ